MKAFANPLLLITCILLLAFGYASATTGTAGTGMVETWALTLCLLGVIINGTLGTARAMTGRPSVQLIGWAVGFLVFGSVVWTLVSTESMESVSSQERALLQQRVEAWKDGQQDACQMDENGDCLVTLAASLGRVDILREVVEQGAATHHAEVLVRAAHRAAEHDRTAVLELLLEQAHLPINAPLEGMTPLHSAAMYKAHRAATCLLELGADANATMPDGTTPLHHAVLAEDAQMVRLLLQHGANPQLLDADGRDAASYARSESVLQALDGEGVQP